MGKKWTRIEITVFRHRLVRVADERSPPSAVEPPRVVKETAKGADSALVSRSMTVTADEGMVARPASIANKEAGHVLDSSPLEFPGQVNRKPSSRLRLLCRWVKQLMNQV